MITSSNFGFQLTKIMNPKTFEDRLIASIYMIGSGLSILSFIQYYKKKYDTIFYTMIYIALRNNLRLLDLE